MKNGRLYLISERKLMLKLFLIPRQEHSLCYFEKPHHSSWNGAARQWHWEWCGLTSSFVLLLQRASQAPKFPIHAKVNKYRYNFSTKKEGDTCVSQCKTLRRNLMPLAAKCLSFHWQKLASLCWCVYPQTATKRSALVDISSSEGPLWWKTLFFSTRPKVLQSNRKSYRTADACT